MLLNQGIILVLGVYAGVDLPWALTLAMRVSPQTNAWMTVLETINSRISSNIIICFPFPELENVSYFCVVSNPTVTMFQIPRRCSHVSGVFTSREDLRNPIHDLQLSIRKFTVIEICTGYKSWSLFEWGTRSGESWISFYPTSSDGQFLAANGARSNGLNKTKIAQRMQFSSLTSSFGNEFTCESGIPATLQRFLHHPLRLCIRWNLASTIFAFGDCLFNWYNHASDACSKHSALL